MLRFFAPVIVLLIWAHTCRAENRIVQPGLPDTLQKGMMVSVVDPLALPPIVKRTGSRDDLPVYGVFVGTMKAEEIKVKDSGRGVWLINISGEASILVTDTGGNLEAGDLISPSSVAGYGERQTVGNLGTSGDDIVRWKTVAKTLETVDWATVSTVKGVKSKLIRCRMVGF